MTPKTINNASRYPKKPNIPINAVYTKSILIRIIPVFFDSVLNTRFLHPTKPLRSHTRTFTNILKHHLITRTIMLDSTNLLHFIFLIIESKDVMTTALVIAAEIPTTIFIMFSGKCPV